jgi:hypothetical protein
MVILNANRAPVVILLVTLLCGCRPLQSRSQNQRIQGAPAVAKVGGTELKLESRLKRTLGANEKAFDLNGEINIISLSGTLPTGIQVTSFSLKPSWSGWPGYFVMNFVNRRGSWESATAAGASSGFSGNSKTEADRYSIDFIWRNQGRALGGRPEHFAAYDVSVTILDRERNRHILANLAVPTE